TLARAPCRSNGRAPSAARSPSTALPRTASSTSSQAALDRPQALLPVFLLQPYRQRADEVAEPPAVARERGQRDPFLRTVVAGADRPELDCRDSGLDERHGVGGSVAADAHDLASGRPSDGIT